MRKKMRKLLLWISCVMMLLATGGCETKTIPESAGAVEEEDRITIGMSFDSFVIERWQRDRDIFVQAAKELGAEVNVQNANGDVDEQIRQIEYLIEKKVDVLVIVCIDSDALSEVVQSAKNAGIRVIAYDRLINDAAIDLYISFDNEMVGTLMAQCLIDHGISGGNVIMIGGSPADNNVSLIEDAFDCHVLLMQPIPFTIAGAKPRGGVVACQTAQLLIRHVVISSCHTLPLPFSTLSGR